MPVELQSRSHYYRDYRGFSLIELMLAMALFMLLAAGALTLLVNARKALNAAENVAELQERAAFVLALLEDDIRLAGYWGLHNNGELIQVAAAVSVRCGSNDISAWALQTEHAFEVNDGAYSLPCRAYGQPAPLTDTLVLRHASPVAVVPRKGSVQIESSPEHGLIFSDGIKPELGSSSTTHNLQLHAWYVDQDSSEAGLPALRRYTLMHNGILQNQEIMPGIEDLQILLGMDSDDDGLADAFITQDLLEDEPVIAIRIRLQLRSSGLEPGFTDTRLNKQDGFRRLEIVRTIKLNNSRPT
jgi:type IV pilus assembly protein PilW